MIVRALTGGATRVVKSALHSLGQMGICSIDQGFVSIHLSAFPTYYSWVIEWVDDCIIRDTDSSYLCSQLVNDFSQVFPIEDKDGLTGMGSPSEGCSRSKTIIACPLPGKTCIQDIAMRSGHSNHANVRPVLILHVICRLSFLKIKDLHRVSRVWRYGFASW